MKTMKFISTASHYKKSKEIFIVLEGVVDVYHVISQTERWPRMKVKGISFGRVFAALGQRFCPVLAKPLIYKTSFFKIPHPK